MAYRAINLPLRSNLGGLDSDSQRFGGLAIRAASSHLFFHRIARKKAVPGDYQRTKEILDELKGFLRCNPWEANAGSNDELFNTLEGKYVIARALKDFYSKPSARESLQDLLAHAAQKKEPEAAKELSEFFETVIGISDMICSSGYVDDIFMYLCGEFRKNEE